MPTFYEFFAGGGMARAGLGGQWTCLFANDFSEMKAATYKANWGDDHLAVGDIGDLCAESLPDVADLAWASFPCQDLSLAGNYAGIGKEQDNDRTRSGTFWSFWKLIVDLETQGRSPDLIVLENVYGILTSRNGQDFASVGNCLAKAGYRFGAMLIDAARFVPQSRPRVFIVGVKKGLEMPTSILAEGPEPLWHPKALVRAADGMDSQAKSSWLWLKMPLPSTMVEPLEQIIDGSPEGMRWHSKAETEKLLSMMSSRNRLKVEEMKKHGGRIVGTIYKRTRQGEQRAELRIDGLAGCLRTPAGGSSRQLILEVVGQRVRSRLLSARETARLMGLPDTYKLPTAYNDAYHVTGDGIAVPAVRHLAANILEPILALNGTSTDFLAVAAE